MIPLVIIEEGAIDTKDDLILGDNEVVIEGVVKGQS